MQLVGPARSLSKRVTRVAFWTFLAMTFALIWLGLAVNEGLGIAAVLLAGPAVGMLVFLRLLHLQLEIGWSAAVGSVYFILLPLLLLTYSDLAEPWPAVLLILNALLAYLGARDKSFS